MKSAEMTKEHRCNISSPEEKIESWKIGYGFLRKSRLVYLRKSKGETLITATSPNNSIAETDKIPIWGKAFLSASLETRDHLNFDKSMQFQEFEHA